MFRRDCKTHGHKFEARYDETGGKSPLDTFWISNTVSGKDWEKIISKKTYVHDICVRCGEVKKRT